MDRIMRRRNDSLASIFPQPCYSNIQCVAPMLVFDFIDRRNRQILITFHASLELNTLAFYMERTRFC